MDWAARPHWSEWTSPAHALLHRAEPRDRCERGECHAAIRPEPAFASIKRLHTPSPQPTDHPAPCVASSQLWITSGSGATIRPAVASQPLLTLMMGAPHVHISNVRVVGVVMVKGGDLELTDCRIEPQESANQQEVAQGRRLSTEVRPLSIDGGDVRLLRVVLTGHAAGALSARTARLIIIESSIHWNRAQTGGAIRVGQGSIVRLECSNLTNNVADTSGGALQVRQSTARHQSPCTPPPNACNLPAVGTVCAIIVFNGIQC